MVISNNARHPGAIYKGHEVPHPSRPEFSGLLFFNDEGSECGGLSYGGRTGKDGKVQSYGSFAFDKYMQDQMIDFGTQDDDGQMSAWMTFMDRPDWPITDALEEWQTRISKLPADQQEAAWTRFYARK